MEIVLYYIYVVWSNIVAINILLTCDIPIHILKVKYILSSHINILEVKNTLTNQTLNSNVTTKFFNESPTVKDNERTTVFNCNHPAK